MYNAERRTRILEKLSAGPMVSVNQLAQDLDASKETIRRDLGALEKEGIVKRIHGGAVLAKQGAGVEAPFEVRAIQRPEVKAKLCQKAAALIQNGDTIFIDNSSTTFAMLRYIDPLIQVTVLTNSVHLLTQAAALGNPRLTMVSSGGVFNPANYSMAGSLAGDWVRGFFPNKCFFSCHGVGQSGLSDGSIYEAELKRSMVKQSECACLLADESKYGRQGVVWLAELEDVDILISDAAPKGEVAAGLKKAAVLVTEESL